MPREMPARPPTEMDDISMAESEPFYHQAMRPELEKPINPKEPLTLRKSDDGAIDDVMDKPVKPLDVGMMDKLMKPSDVQPEGEKSTPGEAEDSHTKATLEKATPGPVRPEESQLECMERRSTRICQPSTRMMESLENQQPRGQKRRPEGEVDDGIENRPAQRLRANLARLAVATELLIGDREYDINEEARS